MAYFKWHVWIEFFKQWKLKLIKIRAHYCTLYWSGKLLQQLLVYISESTYLCYVYISMSVFQTLQYKSPYLRLHLQVYSTSSHLHLCVFIYTYTYLSLHLYANISMSLCLHLYVYMLFTVQWFRCKARWMGGWGGGGIMVITVCFLKRDKWTLYLYCFWSYRKWIEDRFNDFSRGWKYWKKWVAVFSFNSRFHWKIYLFLGGGGVV